MRKKNLGRVLIAVFLVAMLVTAMTVEALAASKSVTFENKATVQVTTGKGFSYFFGKKTTVIFKNTGKRAITVVTPAGVNYWMDPGQSRSFTLSGNGRTYTYTFNRQTAAYWTAYKGKNAVQVNTSAGSISSSSK